MDLVNQVLFDMQQTYFTYVNVLANLGPGSAGPVPDFAELRGKVATYRADSLSPLPAPWYTLIDAPRPTHNNRGTPTSGTSPRDQSGSVQKANNYADRTLVRRFADSSFTSVNSLIAAAPAGTSIPATCGTQYL